MEESQKKLGMENMRMRLTRDNVASTHPTTSRRQPRTTYVKEWGTANGLGRPCDTWGQPRAVPSKGVGAANGRTHTPFVCGQKAAPMKGVGEAKGRTALTDTHFGGNQRPHSLWGNLWSHPHSPCSNHRSDPWVPSHELFFTLMRTLKMESNVILSFSETS